MYKERKVMAKQTRQLKTAKQDLDQRIQSIKESVEENAELSSAGFLGEIDFKGTKGEIFFIKKLVLLDE